MPDIVQEISTDRIDDPAQAMRTELDRDALWELADNIKQNGLINPITVRPVGDRFEVVAGHRRLSACKIAGKVMVACVVRTLTDQETFEIKAAENLERADVDPVDEAIFIADYIKQTGKTPEEVAKRLRRSENYVYTRLAVGAMPDYMQAYIKSGQLKLGAALALIQITDDITRRTWVDMAVRDGVSVAQAEYWLHGWKMNQLPGGQLSSTPPGDFEPGAPRVVKFRCSVDGQEYDARLMKTVFIYEQNLPYLEALASGLNAPESPVD